MTSEDLISPEMFLVGGECFTPIFEEEVEMSKLDVSFRVNHKPLPPLLLLILPLALLQMGLHHHPLKVLDRLLGDRLLLGMLLLVQLDEAEELRVELADDLQLRGGEGDVIVHPGKLSSNWSS